MILESKRGQEIVRYLAKPIVAQLAPEELVDFEDLAGDFFADPRIEDDKTLGSGLGLLPDLVIVLMFVATALDHLLTRGGSKPARPLLERFAQALFGERKDARACEDVPRFSPDDIERSLAEATDAVSPLAGPSGLALQEIQEMAKLLLARLMDPTGRALVGILFLGASPSSYARLGISRELRQVAAAIREAPLRHSIVIHSELAVTVDDLQRTLLVHRPQWVHFAGHGNRSNALLVETEHGNPQEVSAASLSRLLRVFAGQLRCVVLNACFSEGEARAIAGHAEGVIGMRARISDDAATSFSRAFYRALAYGQSLQQAFDLGCSQIDLDGHPQEADIPQLIALRAHPGDIVLVEAPSLEEGGSARSGLR